MKLYHPDLIIISTESGSGYSFSLSNLILIVDVHVYVVTGVSVFVMIFFMDFLCHTSLFCGRRQSTVHDELEESDQVDLIFYSNRS